MSLIRGDGVVHRGLLRVLSERRGVSRDTDAAFEPQRGVREIACVSPPVPMSKAVSLKKLWIVGESTGVARCTQVTLCDS